MNVLLCGVQSTLWLPAAKESTFPLGNMECRSTEDTLSQMYRMYIREHVTAAVTCRLLTL